MIRVAEKSLLEWKHSESRKPLLVQGARQVGKTWLIKEFGKNHYESVAYISFNDVEEAKGVFEPSYNVSSIITALSLLSETTINPHSTLIILDEIQECARALNALKFFNENAKDYHLVACGSLLGVALKHTGISFPVGQVEFLDLYPLNFREFLYALEEDALVNLIDEKNIQLITLMGEKFKILLKQYICIGGMPEAVLTFLQTQDYYKVQKTQNAILEGYQKDFSKYIDSHNVAKIQTIWDSIPLQLGKENKKFSYSAISKSARAREFEDAIEWLCLCGLIHKVSRVSKPSLPLSGYKQNIFKLFMLDTGLLCAKSSLDAQIIIDGNKIFEEFKGSLTEQYVLQEIVQQKNIPLAYWATDSGTAEVDFIFQYKGEVIPMEVKSSINLKARSLASYRQKYNQKKAVRTSLADYKVTDELYDIPLYVMGNFLEFLG